MKRVKCPLNGWCNASEFSYGGTFKEMPDTEKCSAREWADYLFFEDNQPSVVYEWWYHNPTSYWFIVERNTLNDEITNTFDYAQWKRR